MEISKTKSLTSNWLGNGDGIDTKKRKNTKEVRHSSSVVDDIEVYSDDDNDDDDDDICSGLGQKLNGGLLIPKRPRGLVGRSKYFKSSVASASGSVELVDNLTNDLNHVLWDNETVKLNGESAGVASVHRAKVDSGDFIKPIAVLGQKDQAAKLNQESKEILQEVSVADAAIVSGNSTSVNQMGKLNGNFKGKHRNNFKKKDKNSSDGNQKEKDDSAAVVGSSDLEKNEGKADLVLKNKDPSSKRNGSNRRKRKMSGSSSQTTVKKVGSSVDRTELDPDDDLEQNAARMLSSRFDPSCTGFASTNTTLTLLSANREAVLEKPTGNVGSESPMAASDPVSAEDADRLLPARTHQKGKGTFKKRRHFYEMHSDEMDAHWFLNRKIKIFWPLDERWYYGLVNDYDAERNLHHIKYDDRDEEWISLETERFKLLLYPSEVPCKPNSKEDNHNEDKRSLALNMRDESFMASHMESEPIISWLARSSPRIKSSTSAFMKKQKLSHFSSDNSLDVCNGGNIALLEGEPDKPNCSSDFLNISLDRRNDETSLPENSNSSEGHLPIVYVRRRYCRFSAAAPLLLNKADVLKWDTTLIESKKFKICISLYPMLTYVLGVDTLWLIRNVLLLQYGTMVTMWPTVFLEVLFVDNIVGLRLFLFEGCLKQAVVFVFLVMKVFCRPEKDESINQQVPTTSIRFKLSFSKNFKKHKVFAFYSFSKVRDCNWKYLDSEFQPHCLLTKQLSLPDCTYDNIKLLEAETQHSQISYVGRTASFEVFCKKSNSGAMPLLSGSRSSNSVPESRPLTIYSLKRGNLPPFALSFTAAPSFFVSLHLKLLLERSISLQDYADDCSHVEDQLEISSDSSSKSHEETMSSFYKDSAVVCSDGGLNKSSEHVLDAKFDVDKPSISSKSAQTGSVEIGNLDKYQDDNQPSQVLEFHKDRVGSSNLKGIRVEIPASNEICRDFRTPGTQQVSDLTWNISDGIIYSPNPTGPRSLWHRNKSGSSSPLGDPWVDGKTNFIGNGFGNGPKKPRTQVQYTFPSRELSFKNKNHSQTGHPYQRIRKANDRRTSDVSKGPRRNLELVACDTNILINGGEKGWRECGARVFLEAADQNEWKLAVKCRGVLKYSCKVHQDFQTGSTNRYTHAMMWKGGKDWALEFPDRSQWVLFKEMHEECHNRNIRAASRKNIPIPGVRLIDDSFDDEEEMPFTRSPWYLRQVRNDVEMAMDASRVMYDMDSEDEEWLSRSRMQQKQQESEDDMISDELFEKVMDMLEKVSYAQKRDHFTSGEIEELITKVSAMQVAKSIYEHWREKRQRKGMPLIRQLQPPLWEKYQQICREWDQLHPKLTTGAVTGSQEKASAGDKPPMFAFCLKPRGLELLNKGSKHRPHKKISLSGHSHAFLGDHDPHHSSGRRVNTYVLGDERAESSDVSPLITKMYSPRDAYGPGHFSLDCGGDAASGWNHQLRFQRNNSHIIRTAVSPKMTMIPSTFRKSGKRNGQKPSNNSFGDWYNQPSPYRHQGQLVLGGSDLDEFRLRDASSAAKHARNMAKLKRERAQKLMLSADLAIHKAVSALMTAEAIKACTDGSSSSSPFTTS